VRIDVSKSTRVLRNRGKVNRTTLPIKEVLRIKVEQNSHEIDIQVGPDS